MKRFNHLDMNNEVVRFGLIADSASQNEFDQFTHPFKMGPI